MNSDALQALRDANPVPTVSRYSDAEQQERVDAILSSNHGVTSLSGRRRRWVVPAVAAAGVAALAIGLATWSADDDPAPVGGDPTVSCRVSTDGGRADTAVRLATARTVIGARVTALGGTGQSFDLDPGAGTVSFAPRGLGAESAAGACHATTTALRPLVVAPVQIDRSTPRSSDPLGGLGFAVPRDEERAAALTAAQRSRLAEALSHASCRTPDGDAGDAAVVRCAADGSVAYLLGEPLAADADVTGATALEPSVGTGGSAQWTVSVTLDRAAGQQIAAFTTAHSSTAQGGGIGACAAGIRPSCADFLAFEVDGRVLTAPQTDAPLADVPLVVSGAFTQRSATTLAADYNAASIGLRRG